METRCSGDPAGRVPPRPAATIVLTRGDGEGRQVLLLRRPTTSVFAPGAWVFPGGGLEPADYDLDHERVARGPSPAEWAERMCLTDHRGAGAYVVAALREAWEETGILLACGAATHAALARARRDLLSGSSRFEDLLRRLGMRLASRRLRYVAHWVTPESFPRRFDTRFFLGAVAASTACSLLGSELDGHRWVTPERAVREHEAGAMHLLPPTHDTLRRLARHEY